MTTSQTDVDTYKTRIAIDESLFNSRKGIGLPRSKNGSAQEVSRPQSAIKSGNFVPNGA